MESLGIVARHEKIPETYAVATLLTGNAWLFKEKSLAYQVSASYFRILRFLEVCDAQV